MTESKPSCPLSGLKTCPDRISPSKCTDKGCAEEIQIFLAIDQPSGPEQALQATVGQIVEDFAHPGARIAAAFFQGSNDNPLPAPTTVTSALASGEGALSKVTLALRHWATS